MKIRPHLMESIYDRKGPLEIFADSINRTCIYPIWRGHRIIFYKNSKNETDYHLKIYKYRSLAILFFIITMPLLGLTMAIKGLGSKRKYREMKEIDMRKFNEKELRKKAKEDALLKQKQREEQQRLAEKYLVEAKKRNESPQLDRKLKSLTPDPSSSASSKEIALSNSESVVDLPDSDDSDDFVSKSEEQIQIVIESPSEIENPVVSEEQRIDIFESHDSTVQLNDDNNKLEQFKDDIEAQKVEEPAEEPVLTSQDWWQKAVQFVANSPKQLACRFGYNIESNAESHQQEIEV